MGDHRPSDGDLARVSYSARSTREPVRRPMTSPVFSLILPADTTTGHPARQVFRRRIMRTSLIRWCGAAVASGAAAWAAAGLLAGPIEQGANSRLELAGSFAFQIGALCLVAALGATGATGTGRWGRAVLAVQAVLLALAVGWTVPHLFQPNGANDGIMAALDAAWPLSMLWLMVQGATVARSHRWPGPLRWAPLVASLWFPVTIIAASAGDWPGLIVSSLWLIATYIPLGVLLAIRAEAVEAATPGAEGWSSGPKSSSWIPSGSRGHRTAP